METFHLPILDGLHLVEGLCDGVFLGSAALAGFPSLKTLPYSGRLEYHHVNVFQSESKNQTMVIEIDNDAYEGKGAAEIAEMMVGKKTYVGWPFLQEGLVVAVSDGMFRHEMRPFGVGQERLAGQPHSPVEQANWRRNATRIEQVYSRRFAVITGPVELLLHVRPLKGEFRISTTQNNIVTVIISSYIGLKRLDTGALIKDYEGVDKEVEQAVQLGLQEVISEDPRYLEQAAPPMAEEFPIGSRIIFLGEHAYGVAAQVTDTKEDSLTIVIAVSSTGFYPASHHLI
jgi:5'-3' exoribonuclease 1